MGHFSVEIYALPGSNLSGNQQHDFRGKTIRPFITHGGYGVGNSLSVLASHAPGARIEPHFVMEADQERRTLNEINGWLSEIGKS